MVYVLEPGCQQVRRSVAVAHRERERWSFEPADGSQVAAERIDPRERVRQHVNDAVTTAGLRLVAVEEHLEAMVSLAMQPTTTYSVYTVARTVAEISARAWWLLDPDLDAEVRAWRGLLERLYSLRQQAQLPNSDAEDAQCREQELRRQAEDAGLDIPSVYNDRPAGTGLLGDVFGGSDRDLGVHTYKLLSAFTHGTSYALTEFIEPLGSADEHGIVQGQVQTHAGREATAFLMALTPYTEAVRHQFTVHGWPQGHLMSQLLYTTWELSQVMERYQHLDEA